MKVVRWAMTLFLLPVPILIYAQWPIGTLPRKTFADRVVVEKSEHRLTLYRDNQSLKVYRVALGRGGLADKQCEGDNRTPEGVYTIDSRNAQSGFYRALHVSYPDAAHVARARQSGCSAGGSIMVHGIKNGLGWLGRLHRLVDWTAGCIAVTNEEIEELWRVVPDGTPIEIRP